MGDARSRRSRRLIWQAADVDAWIAAQREPEMTLVSTIVPIIEHWTANNPPDAWIFQAPHGRPLNEANWKRSVHWPTATRRIGMPTLRVHDLRHTAASAWLAAGADFKVVQRILGHASPAMTMDLYGHLVDTNLWDAANRVGGLSGALPQSEQQGDAV